MIFPCFADFEVGGGEAGVAVAEPGGVGEEAFCVGGEVGAGAWAGVLHSCEDVCWRKFLTWFGWEVR